MKTAMDTYEIKRMLGELTTERDRLVRDHNELEKIRKRIEEEKNDRKVKRGRSGAEPIPWHHNSCLSGDWLIQLRDQISKIEDRQRFLKWMLGFEVLGFDK